MSWMRELAAAVPPSLYRQKRLADGHGDLVVIVADHFAIAFDNAKLARGGAGNGLVLAAVVACRGARVVGVLAHIYQHSELSVVCAVLSVVGFVWWCRRGLMPRMAHHAKRHSRQAMAQ